MYIVKAEANQVEKIEPLDFLCAVFNRVKIIIQVTESRSYPVVKLVADKKMLLLNVNAD